MLSEEYTTEPDLQHIEEYHIPPEKQIYVSLSKLSVIVQICFGCLLMMSPIAIAATQLILAKIRPMILWFFCFDVVTATIAFFVGVSSFLAGISYQNVKKRLLYTSIHLILYAVLVIWSIFRIFSEIVFYFATMNLINYPRSHWEPFIVAEEFLIILVFLPVAIFILYLIIKERLIYSKAYSDLKMNLSKVVSY
eukprot:gene5604-9421_t